MRLFCPKKFYAYPWNDSLNSNLGSFVGSLGVTKSYAMQYRILGCLNTVPRIFTYCLQFVEVCKKVDDSP